MLTNQMPNEAFASKRTSSNVKIYQIYYSRETKILNDLGFQPLDNLQNPRPDWREYWPIREFLLNNKLDPDALYGFFSPKFKQKTNLSAEKVFKYIDEHDADVYVFSPFFDQSAFYTNIFSQAESNHPGIAQIQDDCFKEIDSSVHLDELIMDAETTVFCNYFVAKPAFWEKWFACCEKIFSIAEDPLSSLGQQLNENVSHDPPAPAKVFIIERVTSFLLATQSWKIAAFNPMELCYTSSYVSHYKQELKIMDALKTAYLKHRFPQYLEMHQVIRDTVARLINETIAQTAFPPSPPNPQNAQKARSFWKFKF